MVAGYRRARRNAVLTALATVGVLLAGCAQHTDDGTGAQPGGGLVSISAGPSASGGPASPPPPTPARAATTAAPAPIVFPNTAQAYGQAAINAWVNGQSGRLAQYTDAGGAAGFTHILGHPDTHWHFAACDGTAGSQYCTWQNNNGDVLTVRVVSQFLGHPHAVGEVYLTATEYPTSPDAYVGEFMQAWHDGNPYRMRALSSSTVTSYFTHYTPPSSWLLADDNTAGHAHVHITNMDGFDQTVDVTMQYLGHPHAISAVCNPTCA